MQGLRNEVQAHNRLRPRMPKRMATPEKPAGTPSALPKLWLLKLQAPLPLGQPPGSLQLKTNSRVLPKEYARNIKSNSVFGRVQQPRVANNEFYKLALPNFFNLLSSDAVLGCNLVCGYTKR